MKYPNSAFETRGAPDRIPECPYWEDGKHCYEADVFQAENPQGDNPRPTVKWCACGAEVKPR